MTHSNQQNSIQSFAPLLATPVAGVYAGEEFLDLAVYVEDITVFSALGGTGNTVTNSGMGLFTDAFHPASMTMVLVLSSMGGANMWISVTGPNANKLIIWLQSSAALWAHRHGVAFIPCITEESAMLRVGSDMPPELRPYAAAAGCLKDASARRLRSLSAEVGSPRIRRRVLLEDGGTTKY